MALVGELHVTDIQTDDVNPEMLDPEEAYEDERQPPGVDPVYGDVIEDDADTENYVTKRRNDDCVFDGETAQVESPKKKRRRGRPKGSKNYGPKRTKTQRRQPKRSGSPVRRPGRPHKVWAELSGRSKQRASKVLLQGHSTEELLLAARKIAENEGKHELYSALSLAIDIEKKASKQMISKKGRGPIPFSEDEAVCINIEQDLPKRVYQELRLSALTKRASIYPPYHKIKDAKDACYPEGIHVNQSMVEVPLQSLLNHTADRILYIKRETIAALQPNDQSGRLKLILSVKWGSDGSSGSSEFRQRFITDSMRESNDADLFCTSMVPLFLKLNEEIVWQNPTPPNVRFCRPISLQLGKETPEMAFEAQIRVENQIRELKPYSTKITVLTSSKDLNNDELAMNIKDENDTVPVQVTLDVYFHLQHTVIDPAMISAVSATNASHSCHICCSSPSPFDQRQLNTASTSRTVNPESFKHVISPLHAWVISFECLIHLACFLPTDSWNNRTDIANRVTQRKADIQRGFKNELNLVIEKPRTGSAVSTNEANTAKRAFQSEEEFSRITGVDQGLIHRFNVILSVLSSEYEINNEEFGLYCQTTAELLNALYHWFNVPLPVHKILYHGASIIRESVLPIGMMSEEAQKARSKKPFQRHTKRETKESAMIEVMQTLMVIGDPVMSKSSLGLRKARQCWKSIVEVAKLLKDPRNPFITVKEDFFKTEPKAESVNEKIRNHNMVTIDQNNPADLSIVTVDPHAEVQTDDPGPSDISFQVHDNSSPVFSAPVSTIPATIYHHGSVHSPVYHGHTQSTYQYTQLFQDQTKIQDYAPVHHAPNKLQVYNQPPY